MPTHTSQRHLSTVIHTWVTPGEGFIPNISKPAPLLNTCIQCRRLDHPTSPDEQHPEPQHPVIILLRSLLTSKIYKSVYVMRRLHCQLPANIMVKLYYSLVYSHLTNGLLAWGRSGRANAC